MPTDVIDRAHLNTNIANCARLLSRSKHRRAVFDAVYFGKKEWKTIDEIAQRAKLSPKRVLEEGKKLAVPHYIRQSKINGRVHYAKDPTLYQHKKKLLAAAGDKKKLAKIPTVDRPHVVGSFSVRVRVGKSSPKPKQITVDSVASFKRVKSITAVDPALKLSRVPEDRIKQGFLRILGVSHKFKDWGGEKNDVFTTRLQLKATRKAAAFAFKGRGTQGTLTPRSMGKRSDQIPRLFGSEADVFFVVYHGKVDESIYEQMRVCALARSMSGQSVHYGVIDGDDLNRLYQAYPKQFKPK